MRKKKGGAEIGVKQTYWTGYKIRQASALGGVLECT